MLNKLIPADDLHWCDIEKKYVSLSEEEITKIITNCAKQNITNFDDIYKILQWAGMARVGNILLNNFLDNKIEIVGFDEMNEPYFGEKKDEHRENG